MDGAWGGFRRFGTDAALDSACPAQRQEGEPGAPARSCARAEGCGTAPTGGCGGGPGGAAGGIPPVPPASFPRAGVRAAPLCSAPNKGAAVALPSGTAEFYIPSSARGASAARPEPRPAGRPGTARPERGCLRRGREGQRPAPGAAGRDPPGTSRLCPALPGAPPPLSTLQSRSPRGTPKETAPSQLSGRAGNGSVSHRREPGSSGGRPGGAASLPQHPRHEHAWEGIPASASHRSLDGAARPAAAAPPGPARPPLAGLRLPPAGRSGERRAEPAAGPPLGWGGGSGAGLRPGGRVGGRGAWAAGVKVRGCGYKGKVRHRGGRWETGSRKSRCP